MKFDILEGLKNFNQANFIEIRFNFKNLKSLNQFSHVKMFDRNFSYNCYKIGNLISVQKSGRHFGNFGSHGVYEYDLTTGSFEKTLHRYQDNHVLSLLRFKHG